MEDLGSALQTWEAMVARYSKKNARVGEVDIADNIKCSAIESTVPENLERHLRDDSRNTMMCESRSMRTTSRALARSCDQERVNLHQRQVLATIRWTTTLWSRDNTKENKCQGK